MLRDIAPLLKRGTRRAANADKMVVVHPYILCGEAYPLNNMLFVDLAVTT